MLIYLFIHLNLFRLFIYLFIQALAEAKKRTEELEKKILENVLIDTAKEIGAYQEKMVSANKGFYCHYRDCLSCCPSLLSSSNTLLLIAGFAKLNGVILLLN